MKKKKCWNKNTGTSAGAGNDAGEMKEKCGGRGRRKAVGNIRFNALVYFNSRCSQCRSLKFFKIE